MRPGSAILSLASALPLAACVVSTPVPETIYAPCHVAGSSEWKARVEIFPSSHPKPILHRMLVVTGKVRVATGAGAAIERGPVARLDEPVQQVLVRAPAPIGEGSSTELRSVRAVFPALKRYGGVEIRCGDGIIAQIPDVPTPPSRRKD
ncbi:MAG TPA: hypothetical protein VHM92_05875 [Allosphingosinicella sp.]|nr:hypothetical protein [Allosphingosinicella sp.]